MGTGSERKNSISSEKAPPQGACPHFSAPGAGPPEKGDRHRRRSGFMRFPANSVGASPHFRAAVFTLRGIMVLQLTRQVENLSYDGIIPSFVA
jgi:hypothetical protein